MSDLISRQAAITQLSHNKNKGDDEWELAVECDIQTIWKLPSAQPTFDARDTQYNLPIGTDLISRQQAIDALHTWFMDGFDEDKWWNSTHVLAAIEGIPSAQPEIIRCKDCKHWVPYDWMFSEVWQSKNIADYPEDEIGCDCCDMAMKANDFCSRGER